MASHVERRMITGFTRRFKQNEFATVRMNRFGMGVGDTGRVGSVPVAGGVVSSLGTSAPALSVRLPSRRTEYFTTEGGVAWLNTMADLTPEFVAVTLLDAPPSTYRAGQVHTERWNYPVMGPTLPRTSPPVVRRTGDTLKVELAFGGDGAGRHGVTFAHQARITLFRNGEQIARQPFALADFAVPPEPAEYRVEGFLQPLPGVGSLSTRTEVAWTFRSAHVDGTQPAPLPIWATRFIPPVDDFGVAPAGQLVAIPVIAETQAGGNAGKLRTLSVQASFDEGQTWQDVPVVGLLSRHIALVRHPAADGFVALRSIAEDSNGNKLTQTTLRAYRIAAQR